MQSGSVRVLKRHTYQNSMKDKKETLITLAVSIDCSGGIPTSRSFNNCCIKKVISRPAIGICLIQLPITYPSAYIKIKKMPSKHLKKPKKSKHTI